MWARFWIWVICFAGDQLIKHIPRRRLYDVAQCLPKKRFKTSAVAIEDFSTNPRRPKEKLWVYPCKFCHSWHKTKKEPINAKTNNAIGPLSFGEVNDRPSNDVEGC